MNGSVATDVTTVTDYFAAAQFAELSDTDKLSRPSFEQMDAGVTLAGDAVVAGGAVGAAVEFETIIFDVPWVPRRGLPYFLPLLNQMTLLQRSATMLAPIKMSGLSRFAPPPAAAAKLAFDEETFVVADTSNAGLFSSIPVTFSKGAALAALADHLVAHPEDTGRLQVIPEHEAIATP